MCIRWITIHASHHKHTNQLPWKYSKITTSKFSVWQVRWKKIITTSHTTDNLIYSLSNWVFISNSTQLCLLNRLKILHHQAHLLCTTATALPLPMEIAETTASSLKTLSTQRSYPSFYIIISYLVFNMGPRCTLGRELKNILFIHIASKENLYPLIKRNGARCGKADW